MNTAIATVTLVYVFKLLVGIAHALLGRKAERLLLENPLTFLDALLEVAQLEQQLGTDQHTGNVARVKLQAGIDTGKSGRRIARLALVVGKPCERHGLDFFLANGLFQGIQSNSHLSLQGKQNRFVCQKDRYAFTNDIGTGARLVHESLGQSFRNFLARGILQGARGTGLIEGRQEGIVCHTEFTPGLGAAQNIQKFVIEHKAFIINNL